MRKPDTQTVNLRIASALLILLTLTLSLLAPSFAFAQSREKSPLDTQLLPVGELFSLIIRADGESNPPARITADSLPSNAVLLRNLDGSRTFMWIPQEDDIGEKTIEVTVTDAENSAIAATYPIHFEVVSQLVGANAVADKVETIAADNTDSADSSEPITSKVTTDTAVEPETEATVEPETEATVEPEAEATVEPEAEATVEPETEATVEPETEAAVEPETEAAVEPETEAAVETNTDTSAEGDDVEEEQLPPPELDVPSQVITAPIDMVMRVSIAHRDLSGTPANLTALNMPKNARLEASAEGHVFEWTPEALDIGETAIILIAQDKQSPELRTARRLNISVSR